jgi:hypothetical protein
VRRSALVPVAVASLLAAGCGGTTRYTLEETRECLRAVPGIELRQPPRSDFVASTALGGAFNVKFPANQVTASFGEDEAEAGRLATAYRRFRGENIGIESALQVERNAVLIWGISPSDPERRTIEECLKG